MTASTTEPRSDEAVKWVKHVLGEIDRHEPKLEDEPKLQAVVERLEATALVEARRCDELAAFGTRAGPLHGLPIVVKDIIDVSGQPTRSGSLARANNPACERVAKPRLTASDATHGRGLVALLGPEGGTRHL